MKPIQRLNSGILRRFQGIETLSDAQIDRLRNQAELLQAEKKSLLMDLGDERDISLYLIEGTIELKAVDGKTKIIHHTDTAARSPLCRLRPCRYRITAQTPVTYFTLDNKAVTSLQHLDDPSTLISQYEVSEFSGDNQDVEGVTSQLLVQIYGGLSQKRVLLLSWHGLLSQLAPAILGEKDHRNRMAEVMMLDPVLALKAYKHSLSANPEADGSLLDALDRLDVSQIHHTVFMNLFGASMRPSNEVIVEALQQWWERAITVAAVARHLSQSLQLESPDFMALAGLVHNIGEAAVLSYAHVEHDNLGAFELKEFMRSHAKEVGEVLLTLWKLPVKFRRAVADSDQWLRDAYRGADGGDILLVARALTLLARREYGELPRLYELPAYHRLGLQQDSAKPLLEELRGIATNVVSDSQAFLDTLN